MKKLLSLLLSICLVLTVLSFTVSAESNLKYEFKTNSQENFADYLNGTNITAAKVCTDMGIGYNAGAVKVIYFVTSNTTFQSSSTGPVYTWKNPCRTIKIGVE